MTNQHLRIFPNDELVETVQSESSRLSRGIEIVGKSVLGAAAGAVVGAIAGSAVHSLAYATGQEITPQSMEMIKFAYEGLTCGGALMGIPYIFMGSN